MKKKVLIFIVAYNAERTIEKVLNRIPDALLQYDTEILVIDDASKDATFARAQEFERRLDLRFKVTALCNPVNQGYGGNQKIGYQYAIRNGFDCVALLHGDGQYAPEKLPELIEILFAQQAAAVFGSRMLEAGQALRGGMPLYKYVGNKILTSIQNRVLGQQLSEFHSGYRIYSVAALAQLPFQLNTRDFHFDTEIIIQLVIAKLKIVEHPIPTYYGDEICHVDGIKYAWDVIKTSFIAKLQGYGIFYQRRFDITPADAASLEDNKSNYQSKTAFESTHSLAIADVPAGAAVVDIGCGGGFIARELQRKGCKVTGLDQLETPPPGVDVYHRFHLDQAEFPISLADSTHVLLLDVIEHAAEPEQFMHKLYRACNENYNVTFIVSTGNVAFGLVRLSLLLGSFRYGKRGILDMTHKRLFTFSTFRALFDECGYEVQKVIGVPAPFQLALGDTAMASFLTRVNELLIKVSKGMFSFQIYMLARPYPSVDYLLDHAILKSGKTPQ
ncbi:MAG TPA: glycosyltransferase [Candidatus Acidoferrum sp.]|nr:glycosyltransferase [Candidatus Acidoferrum sp.]